MRQGEFIALSACTMTLTALGIDIMLPAFAELRRHFGLSSDSTAPAQVITFFFMGQVAQLLFGILSDRYGRLAILRIGFPLYIIGGVAAAFAPSLTLLYVARFIAGMGAAAIFMNTIAGVRDRFVGNQMARTMSLIFTIFLFTPIFAPFLGIAILSFATWQLVFLTPPIVAVIVFVWSLRMEESLPVEKRVPLNWNNIRRSIKMVLTNKTFLRYLGVTTILFTGLSSYVSGSEHIIGEIYKKPHLFPWIFGGMGAVMSICSYINSHFAMKFGARKSIKALLITYTIVSGVLLAITLIAGDPPLMPVFFAGLTMLMAINLAVEPNGSSLSMEPMGDIAGTASAVYGTIFFFVGSALGVVITQSMKTGVLPHVLGFFIIGLIALTLIFSDKRPHD